MSAEPIAIWSGEFRCGEVVLKCHVLDDGRRIVEQESVKEFINWIARAGLSEEEITRFAGEFGAWMRGGK